MAQEAIDSREIGTCLWFKNTFGYLGFGIYTNNSYEKQVYVHYKNIQPKGLRNKNYSDLKEGDICEFEVGTGYYCEGTQALRVRLIEYAKDWNEG